MTQFQQHVERWKNGCGSCLCDKVQHRCFARGSLPADVLFCGEAPGQSEDVIGRPFVGPAGKLLDQIIEQAMPKGENWSNDGDPLLTTAFTNLVACFPAEEKAAGVNEPPQEAIEACAPRLREFVAMAKPRLIVCVGDLAGRWAPKLLTRDSDHVRFYVAITHPAALLRQNVSVRGLNIQKCVVALADAVEALQ